MTDTKRSDPELFDAWGAGDAGAGRALHRRLAPRISRFFASKVLPHDADELVQETWLALMRSSRQRREQTIEDTIPSGTELAEPETRSPVNVRAYALGIARHVLFQHYRRLRKEACFDPETDCVASLLPSLSRALSLRRRVHLIEAALAELPVDVQLLAEARYIDGLSGPELARMFGIPEGTVRSRLARVRNSLADLLPDGDRGASSSDAAAIAADKRRS